MDDADLVALAPKNDVSSVGRSLVSLATLIVLMVREYLHLAKTQGRGSVRQPCTISRMNGRSEK